MRLTISERETLSDAETDLLGGTLLDDKYYNILISEDSTIYKPDGSLLLRFCKNCLPTEACRAAYRNLRTAARTTSNRGLAAGRLTEHQDIITDQKSLVKSSSTRVREVKSDGTVSNTTRAVPVESGIAGFFDRSARFPFCRQTAFNMEHADQFAASLPYFQAVDRVFAREVPDRYAAQKSYIERTHPDFYIHGTVFTTVTVNRNWQTACHKDKGDLKAGFGILSVLPYGQYSGGYLVIPKFRVAVDVRFGDVLLYDVHEWHGNTPIVGRVGQYERLSCVLYYRERMEFCGSVSEELEFAKSRQQGDLVSRVKPGQ